MKKNHFLIRLQASCLLSTFILTQFLPPSLLVPSAYAAPQTEVSFKIDSKTLGAWTLPKELGRVSYPFTESGEKPSLVVLLIEDAHAIPSAQESIRQILQHLQTNSGLKTVFFEGAEGRMDPLLFRAFADKKNLQTVFNQYRDRGELSGVTLAAVLNPGESVYEGVESQPLYKEQINAWLEADSISAVTENELNVYKTSFLQAETHYATKELYALNEAERRFEQGHDLEAWFTALNQTASRAKIPGLEARYPAIAALLQEMQGVPDAQTTAEIHKALEILFAQVTERMTADVQQELFEKKQAYLTEALSAGAFARALVTAADARKIKIEPPAILSELIRRNGLLENVRGPEFFEQLERFNAEVHSAVTLTPEDHGLEQMRLRLKFFEKLVRLELTRKEWNAFSEKTAGEGQSIPKNIPDELLQLETRQNELAETLAGKDSVFIRFYTLAEKREEIFWEKIQPALMKGAPELAAFVGGGFHTDGLRDKLKKAHIAHAVITPQMTLGANETSFYRASMRGQVSWGSGFDRNSKVLEPYKVFSRAAAAELAKKAQAHQIKLWQRAVKEAVSQKGQTQDLPGYLQFLPGGVEASKIPDSFMLEWKSTIQRFIGNLKQTRLNPAAGLLTANAMTATPEFANPLVPASRFPAEWRLGQPSVFTSAAKRSEVRLSKEVDYAELKGLEHVKNATVISLQMEMGYSAGFLKEVEAKFGKKTADQVSQATLTGGLGALMHDLFPSWKANGLDIIGIHPIWEEIKKKPYPEGPLHLGQYQRQVMEEGMAKRGEQVIEYTVDLNFDEDYKRYAQENEKARDAFGRKVHVRALKEYTSQYGAPNYHLDAYYLIDESKPDTEENRHRVFDTVYSDDHPAWRDYHLAVYARASEQLIKILKKQGVVKENTVEIHNEVFVSMPKMEADPHRTLVHINHSAYLPTIYSPNVKSYGLLGFPAWMRQYIVKDGSSISIVDFAALNYDLLTGVAIDEHYWVLRRNIFRNAGARLDHYNDGEIRSTNGVLTEHWQSLPLQQLIEHTRILLGLPEKVDSVVFYKTLEGNEPLRKEFIARQEFIKAAEAANFLAWMADIQKQPLWLEDALQQSGKTRADFDAFFKAVDSAAQSNSTAAWNKIKTKYEALRDILLLHPMVSNVRRQVPYKGPEKWLEVLYGLRDSADKLAAFKKTNIRVIIGGRTFSGDADRDFQNMKQIIKDLGLEQHFAFIEDYNVFDAAIMFRAMAGVVMLSDEFLEASATSMMKGVVNGAALIGVWGGAMPELFKITDETGQVIDIFAKKTPHNLVVKNLRERKWKLVNGYLVRYSKEMSLQAGGGRRPDAEALATSLFWLNEQYADPAKRQELLWQSVSGTPKVDMREGQARAHMQLIERLLTSKERVQRDVFEAMTFNPADLTKILKDEGAPFVWRHHYGEEAIFKPGKESPRGIFGLVNMFREISTYGNGDERGKFSIESIRHHALRGDLFQFILHELRDAPPSLKPFMDEIKRLAAEAAPIPEALRRIQADPEQEDEYLVGLTRLTNLNIQALEMIEKLGLWIAKQSFETYLDDHDPEMTARLNSDIFSNHFVKKYLSRYLDRNSEAVPLYTRDSLIRAYGILHQGQPYIFGINLGADPTFDRTRPQNKAYTDIPLTASLKTFAGMFVSDYFKASSQGGVIYQVDNAKNEEEYASYDLGNSATVISLGIPSPEGVQLLELVQRNALAAQLLVAPRTQVFDTASLQKFLSNLEEKARGTNGVLAQDKIDEQMLEIAHLKADVARTRFGKYLPRMMGLIAVLSPKYLDKIKDWDGMVYASLKKRMTQNRQLFETGTLSIHKTSREQTVVISRVIAHENKFSEQNIIFALEFSEEPINQDDGKVGSRVLELAPIALEPTHEYDVLNVLSGIAYQAVRTGAELLDGWTIRVPVRDFYERGEKIRHGWGIDIYQIRSVTPRFDLIAGAPEPEKIATPNLMLGLNMLDMSATFDNTSATVKPQAGMRKLNDFIPTIEQAGFGTVYPYGGLFTTSEISKKLHSVDNNAIHWIGDTDDGSLPRVLVSVNGYNTKRDGNLRDNHGNAFSVDNLSDIDPRHASSGTAGVNDTEKLLTQATAKIGAIFDFIFWRGPESVTSANYKQYFYRELTASEKEDWDDARTDDERLKVMKNLTRTGGHFAVRIEEGGVERLILVQHMFNEPGRDQAVRNPFNPEVIAQSKKDIELAIDRGAHGIRIDLAHKLLNSELKTMMDLWQSYGWQTDPSGAYRPDYEPLKDLIEHGKKYAESKEADTGAAKKGEEKKKREFYVIAEAYMPYHHDALRKLGVDAVYYENPYKDYLQLAAGSDKITARHLGEALETAVKNKDLFVFPSNFDLKPLRITRGSREAFLLALVILAKKGVPVMLDARELMDQHGQLIPIPGGEHPFPTSEEIRKRRDFEHFLWQFERAPFVETIREFLQLINGRRITDIQFLDNENRDQFITMDLAFEQGEGAAVKKDHLIVILNMKPSEDRSIWSQGTSTGDLHEMTDLQTGERFAVNQGRINGIVFPADVQYRILRPVTRPAESRSEVRRAVHQSVVDLAQGQSVSQPAVQSLIDLPNEGFEAALTEIENEARRPDIVALAYQTSLVSAGDEGEAVFSAAHPQFENQTGTFLADSIQAVRDSAHNTLLTHPSSELHFAMAFPLQMERGISQGLLDLAQMLRNLRDEYPGRVKATMLLLADSADLRSESNQGYLRALGRTGVAKILASDDPQLTVTAERFLRDNPNALVWGAFEDVLKSESRIHLVRNREVSLKVALPFAFLLSRKLAEARFLTAELLKKVPDSVQGGAIAYHSGTLEVTHFARDLIMSIQAAKLLEIAA